MSADEKRTVTVEIAGSRYRMTTDSGEEHLRRLAEHVNSRVDALGVKAVRSASPAQLLAIVALTLAEDLEVAERKCEGLEDGARKMVRDAVARIDARLAEDARAHGPTGSA